MNVWEKTKKKTRKHNLKQNIHNISLFPPWRQSRLCIVFAVHARQSNHNNTIIDKSLGETEFLFAPHRSPIAHILPIPGVAL